VEDDPEPVAERFLDDYERTFGSILDEQLEIVCVRAIATTPLERDAAQAAGNGNHGKPGGTPGTTRAWSFTAGQMTDFAVVERGALRPGEQVDGPAIVREQTTTTYVDREFRATVGETGALMIARAGEL
jgi:N-methylhydantoinase A